MAQVNVERRSSSFRPNYNGDAESIVDLALTLSPQWPSRTERGLVFCVLGALFCCWSGDWEGSSDNFKEGDVHGCRYVRYRLAVHIVVITMMLPCNVG